MKILDFPQSKIEELFIETAGAVAESFSLNRIVGQLYALLYIRCEPVSLDEMAAELKISKGSASVNIRILENWNSVKKVWVQGSRKDFYTAEPDILKIISERLQQGIERRLTLAKSRKSMIQSLLNHKTNHEKNGKTNFYRARMKQLEEVEEIAELLLTFLPKVKSIRKLKAMASFL